jgi:hypothetical protein
MKNIEREHVCYGCGFNIEDKRCSCVHEFDAQCDRCLSKDECLSKDPREKD